MKRTSTLLFLAAIVCTLTSNVFSQYNADKFRSVLTRVDQISEQEAVLLLIKQDVPDYYPAEITSVFKKSYPAIPEDKTIRVLPFVRENMIEDGEDYQRVKKIALNLLKYMDLQNRIRLIYFNSDVPVTGFTYPFALIISNAAAGVLSDDELESVLAHEIAHLIVYANFKEAVDNNNLKQLRTIELFCDAAAIAIIKTKGKDPGNLITGLDKMQKLLERVNNDPDGGTFHPTMKQRRKFFGILNQKFDSAMSRAAK